MHRRQKLPRVPTWPQRALLVNAAQLAVVLLAGPSWERWLSGTALLPLPGTWSPWAGGAVAYLIATFVFYWWHRWRHQSDFLWRFHPIHRSAQRLEAITSFYKHPAEMDANSVIGAVRVYGLLGLSPEGGAVYTLCTAVGELLCHGDWRTPRWLGYVFQRPEMHRVHHAYGWHRNNYGDLAIWDMLFGTWSNPRDWAGRCGFDAAREERLTEMLALRDVHR